MRRWPWSAAAILPLLLALATPAAAVRQVSGEPTAKLATTSALSTGRAAITLHNPSDTDTAVLVAPRTLTSSVGAAALPARWVRRDTGLGPDSEQRFLLAPNTTVELELAADLPAAGTWEATLHVVTPATAPPLRFLLSLTRTAAPVPAELLLQPDPARTTIPFPGLWLSESARLRLRLRALNAGDQPLDLAPPAVSGTVAVIGGTQVAAGLPTLPLAEPGSCVGTLAPKRGCALDIVLPAGMPPGRYAVTVALPGAAGGQATQTQVVDLRLSAIWAALAAILGAAIGTAIEAWRRTGRPTLATRIAVAERADRARRLAEAPRLPALGQAAAALRQAFDGLDAALRRGGQALPDMAPYDERLRALEAAAGALAAAATLPLPAAALTAPERAALVQALTAAAGTTATNPAQSAALVQATQALQAAVADVAELLRIDAAAAHELQRTDAALRALLDDPQLNAAWEALAARREESFAAPLPGTAPGAVAARLQGLNRDLQQLVAARAAAVAGVPQRVAKRALDLAATYAPDQTAKRTSATALAQQADALVLGWAALGEGEQLAQTRALHRRLTALTQGRTGIESAAGAARGTETVPRLFAADTALVFDPTGLFAGPASGAPLAALEAYQDRWDRLTNLGVAVGIGCAAILVLWNASPAWGTPVDFATAVLAGIGTRLAAGLAAKPS